MTAFTPATMSAVFCSLLLSACAAAPQVAACKTYCNTQDEGYRWAESARLRDARACAPYPQSFKTGCQLAVTDAQLSANPRDAF